MSKPVEFGEFYKLLKEVRDGNAEKSKELEWILAAYEHAKDASSPYDELGQIFCHHGVMELYDYTGIEDISYIKNLDISVWNYLQYRMKIGLQEYMLNSMVEHANSHKLSEKLSKKWNTSKDEIEDNMQDLAKYVAEGIIELVN